MSELKRCPFCGEGFIPSGKNFYAHPVIGCLLDGFIVINDAESIKRWNTRKPMQNIVERLEEVGRLELKTHGGRCNGKTLALGYAKGVENAIEIVKEEGEINR